MPLTFELTKIENWKTLCHLPDGAGMNPVTENIIFMTMAVDIGKITDENWREFAIRARMLGLLDANVTPSAIKSHIGLRCNVSTKTNVQFKTKLDKILRDKAARFVDHDVKTTIEEVGDAIADST